MGLVCVMLLYRRTTLIASTCGYRSAGLARRKVSFMAITGKQVRQLRSLAHHLEPVVFIGKQDITPTIIHQTNLLLDARELIKGTVQNTSGLDVREAAYMLADATESEMIQIIGRKFVLYRESDREDIEHVL